jgi:BirA family transcriptional regulator, biotin operon repressor / biotin---[acetyl-CoA-carboxylase] ligase
MAEPSGAGAGIVLPAGFRLLHVPTIGSTNTEALARAGNGEASGLWILADAQVEGRGRSGRVWTSRPDNLHASLLIRPACGLAEAQQLTLLAPVAVHDAIAAAASDLPAGALRLKWPNDVLLNAKKTGGILIETAHGSAGRGLVAVIGIGINVGYHPDNLDQPTTDLAAEGIVVGVADLFEHLARSLARWLAVWNEGRCLEAIRSAWLDRAGPIGEPISVRQGDSRRLGRFGGLDPSGALVLIDEAGNRQLFSHGQIALGHDER